MTEPCKFFSKNEYDSGYSFIDQNFRDSIESLEEALYNKWELEILLENWDRCHNKEGLAIDPPDNINYDSAFMSGDFIKTVKFPNSKDNESISSNSL